MPSMSTSDPKLADLSTGLHASNQVPNHRIPETATTSTGDLQLPALGELCVKCRPMFERLPQVGHNLYYGTLVDCEDFSHWDTLLDLKASATGAVASVYCLRMASGSLGRSGPILDVFHRLIGMWARSGHKNKSLSLVETLERTRSGRPAGT